VDHYTLLGLTKRRGSLDNPVSFTPATSRCRIVALSHTYQQEEKMRDSFRRFAIAALPIFLFGCAAAPPQRNAPDSAFEIVSFRGPASVSVDAPYTVTLTCRELQKVEVLRGNFFRNGEGPFEYPVASIDADRGEVKFDLNTRNPGRYALTGRIVFRERLNGRIRRSNLASAGSISAQ